MVLKYPSIPEPTLKPESLRDSILSIKQMLEILTGQRGSGDNAALIRGDAVATEGGTMTGPLKINDDIAWIGLGSSSADGGGLFSYKGTVDDADHNLRWGIEFLGDPETGGNSGSNFQISRYSDAGVWIDTPVAINRATGNVTLKSKLLFPLGGALWDQTTGGTSNAGRTILQVNNDSFEVLNEAGTAFIIQARYADQFPLFKTDPIITCGLESALTAAQQTQARVNVRASPMDAMAFQNLIINGGMECDQQNSGAAVSIPANSYKYPVDQWVTGLNHVAATASATAQRGVGGAPVGQSYLSFNCSTALSSPAAGDYAYIGQWMEGYRINKLWWGTGSAQALTLGFWVYSNISGTASVSFRNSAGDRSYVTSFSVVAGTWSYIVKTIPGCPTGTWVLDNGIGLSCLFFFACGTGNQTSTPDTWLSSGAFAVSGATNFFATAGNFVALSGVTLIAGNELLTQDLYAVARVIRPMPDELILSQRYWQKLDLPLVGFYSNGAGHNRYDTFPYLNEMRVAPTVSTFTAPSTLQNVNSWGVGVSGQIGTKSLRADLFATAAGVCYEQGGVYALSSRLV